jgi:succinate dehydrogenase / fumarate reductase, flavoprotein subunit
VLAALSFHVMRGGGSRGARTICSPEGDQVPLARKGPLTEFRFRSERVEDRAEQILARLDGDKFICSTRPVRRRDRSHKTFFERDWRDFLTGAIFDPGS